MEMGKETINYFAGITEVFFTQRHQFKVNYIIDIWKLEGAQQNLNNFRVYCSESHIMALTKQKIVKFDFTLRDTIDSFYEEF